MRALLGPDAEALLAALELPPARGLRVNTLKLPVETLRQRVPWHLVPVSWCDEGFLLTAAEAAEAAAHPLHAAGAYYLQDPSAMLPAAALAAAPGESVCDLAAAPGGKTTQLAASMAGRGVLVANDTDPTRVRALLSNVERWGAPNVVVTQADPARLARAWPGRFDRVLLDAPCSGEGMFRKSVEARRQWSEGLVARCAGTQAQLLDAAARLLKPGGVLAYSTCTFEPDENEGVVAAFLQRNPSFTLERIEPAGADRPLPLPGAKPAEDPPEAAPARLWPHRQAGDGHFVALLRKGPAPPSFRRADGGARDVRPRGPGAGYGRATAPSTATVRAWRSFADRVLGSVPFEEADLLLHGERLLATPPGLRQSVGAADGVHLVRVGVLLGRLRGRVLEPAHALAMAAPPGGASVALAPGGPRVVRFVAGHPFDDAGEDGFVRVCVEGLPLGWGRRSNGTVRSLLPSGLRRAPMPNAG
jgi:NOL1/NOP2/sun family putative RNA methylase